MNEIKIGDFIIGSGKTFVIAELSANHNGSLEIALESVRAAKEAGADCIKLQTYTADTITLDVKSDLFKINKGTAWDGKYLYDLYKEAYTPWEWHKQIFDEASRIGLICFSSPFDFSAVDFLEKLSAPAYKIASFEITDIPLISKVAKTKKPIIISTGIATEDDIQLAIDTCLKEGNNQIILLQCTSEYPAAPENAILSNIAYLKNKFNVLAGLSDHTLGIEAPIISVALGASVIEKHFILDKSLGGVDSHFSLDKNEFKQMVDSVRLAEKMIGQPSFELTAKKEKSREFSRSLFVTKDIKAGELFTSENIKSVRPSNGLHPKYYFEVIGKSANIDLTKGTPLSLTHIQNL